MFSGNSNSNEIKFEGMKVTYMRGRNELRVDVIFLFLFFCLYNVEKVDLFLCLKSLKGKGFPLGVISLSKGLL